MTKDIGKQIVYTDGKIWSKYSNKFLKHELHKKGYTKTHLNYKGKNTKVFTHRIIAETFLPNPLNLPEVDHINGIKTDNRIENLRWCTSEQNIKAYQERILNVI